MSNKALTLKLLEEENEEDEYTITEVREALMIPPNSDGNPTLRSAHFLKPLLNPKIQPLPKAPFLSLCSYPNINIEDLRKLVCFKGRLRPLRGWKSWVDDLRQTHQSIWKKVGIFEAIAASTYNIRRDDELVMCLAERWCCETNTFVFEWGECTLTLEDVLVLGGFPVLGVSPVLTPFSKNYKYAEIKGELVKSFTVIYRNCNNHLTHIGWMDYFKGMGGEIEHVAFLVLWLSRYVFSSNFYCLINQNVFGIAISLVMGTKIAFAPTVLASIYSDLALLREKIVSCSMEGVDDGSELVLWGLFQLVQLWAWERFPTLSPKQVSLVQGEPRVARWHNVTKLKTRNLRPDIESPADSFIWRPYTLCLKNWVFPKFYCDEQMWLLMDSEMDEEVLSFVRCLRASELVGFGCVMQYLPHRVGLQFGMDQDIPDSVPRLNADLELAWSSYAKPSKGLKLYLPPRLFEADLTETYCRWWRPELDFYNDALINYDKRKRSHRKMKRLSQLLDGGVGGSCRKVPLCSSFEGKTSQKLSNVVDEIASSTTLNPLNGQEDTEMNALTCLEEDKGKEMKRSNMTANGGSKPSEKCHSQNAESSIMAPTEPVIDPENNRGSDAMTLLPTMALREAGNVTEPLIGPEDNHLGDAMALVMKQAYNSSANFEEGNGHGKQFGKRSLEIESRIRILERLVSVYKAAKFGST